RAARRAHRVELRLPGRGSYTRAVARARGGAVMTELAGQGRRAFLIVPIGFVSDHVEVLYDVDVMYRELAGRLGVRFERTTSLNDDPLLVGALAEIARATAAARGWT